MIVNKEKKIGILFKRDLIPLGTQGFFVSHKKMSIIETLDQVILIQPDGSFEYFKNRNGARGPFEPTQEQIELFTEMLL
jgi:hypothetical protein